MAESVLYCFSFNLINCDLRVNGISSTAAVKKPLKDIRLPLEQRSKEKACLGLLKSSSTQTSLRWGESKEENSTQRRIYGAPQLPE